jgi:hypothetical protein
MTVACIECGGTIEPVIGPGRMRQYRHVTLELPTDFVMPTCQRCGAIWLDTPTVHRLDTVLRRLYDKRP